MKKLLLLALLVLPLALPVSAATPPPNVIGIVRHMEAHDFFWYVDPLTKKRFFVSNASELAAVVASHIVNMSNGNLARIALDAPPPNALGGNMDSDRDGLSDEMESLAGSNASIPDSDGDGYSDGLEVMNGYDPLRGNRARLVHDQLFADQFKGMFVRQVENHDALWYLSPVDGRRMLLGPLDEAFFTLLVISPVIDPSALVRIPISPSSAMWLHVPPGFKASFAATDLYYPRALSFDTRGHLGVSELGLRSGVDVLADDTGDGIFDRRIRLIGELDNPHGIAFTSNRIYVATEKLLRYWPYDPVAIKVTGAPKIIKELPAGSDYIIGQGHVTRTIQTGSDGMLYLSVGSNCNSCTGQDATRAKVTKMDLEGRNEMNVARGLRNTVFFAEDPATHLWWGNDMGQDELGDDYPPDELNQLGANNHYGWPYCVADEQPIPLNQHPERCGETTPPAFVYSAHSAPLGLRFVPPTFDAGFAGSLLSASHGSTIRSSRIGYKISRIIFGTDRKPIGMEDFVTGFLRGQGIVARPVDMVFDTHGNLYVSDDYARVIYKISKE